MDTHSENTSYWTLQSLASADVLVVGGGIVGVSAAISLEESDPTLKVCILDKQVLLLGASVRNAGFACFGSLSEVLDDIDTMGEAAALETVSMRWQGLQLLRERCTDVELGYTASGGYEVFGKDDESKSKVLEQRQAVNQLLAPIVGVDDCFTVEETNLGTTVVNRLEGLLNPSTMMYTLMQKAAALGIQLISGVEVHQIDEKKGCLLTSAGSVPYRKLILATNAWTCKLLPNLQVSPARNHVLVTSELPSVPIDGGYHMDRGYVYFRNIDSRILIGGARHIVGEAEYTYDMKTSNEEIKQHLVKVLEERILAPEAKFEIEYEWTGLLGVGPQKRPILEKYSKDVVIAARMGGMGVAIGSFVGKEAATLLLQTSNNEPS